MDSDIKAQMREEAAADAVRLDAALTDAQRTKLDAATAHVRELAQLRRGYKKRLLASIDDAQRRRDSPQTIMKMTDSMEEKHKAACEVLEARFLEQREELDEMLGIRAKRKSKLSTMVTSCASDS